jgi:hypothetical protein
MSATLAAALNYAACGLPVFPCIASGLHRKDPLTRHGFKDASRDRDVITTWWRRWPKALIGMPTGSASGRNVLDIDVKDPQQNGFDTLARIGWLNLPPTSIVRTASGGAHLHFDALHGIRNTTGAIGRGIGPGLDWRGTGGYVILPSPDSGYSWDEYFGQNYPLAGVPLSLLPREPARRAATTRPVKPAAGLSLYADAALDRACRAIIDAPNTVQERTLVREAFSIGTLAGAGGVPAGHARDCLIWAGNKMTSYDPHRPWRAIEIKQKVDRAFDAGMAHPRAVRTNA